MSAAIWLPVALVAAADSRPTADEIARLISDLGSEEYTVRESATEALTRIGLPAFAPLQAAANHPDREIRYRSQRVLGIIRRHDIERRLEAFLSGTENEEEYPLPAWNRFKHTYGDTPEQRRLFVDMQRADAELLRALEENPLRAAESLAVRTLQAQQALQLNAQAPSLAQVTAALFAAAEPDVTCSAHTLSILFRQCFYPAVRESLDGAGRREVPRKMLAAIITRCDDLAAPDAMTVAAQFNLSEGIIPAVRILKNPDGVRGAQLIQRALVTIAKLGDASHLPLVNSEKLLRDETQLAQFRENDTTYVIQLRDIALAAAVLLSQQDPKIYFDIPQNQPFDDPQMIFLNPRLIGFPTDEKRAEVFAKWEKRNGAGATAGLPSSAPNEKLDKR